MLQTEQRRLSSPPPAVPTANAMVAPTANPRVAPTPPPRPGPEIPAPERGLFAPLLVTNSPIHGRGCFALHALPPDTVLLEYLGERIGREEAEARCASPAHDHGIYVLAADEDATTFLDAEDYDLPARYVNHCCTPNCRVLRCGGRVYYASARAIAAGEELTIDYAYPPEYRTPCRCGSPHCRGYM